MKTTKTYTDSSSWKQALQKARAVLENTGNTEYLKKAGEKMVNVTPGFKKLWEELQVLLRLSKAYQAGDYRRIPLKSMLLITASILYFINPLDVLEEEQIALDYYEIYD